MGSKSDNVKQIQEELNKLHKHLDDAEKKVSKQDKMVDDITKLKSMKLFYGESESALSHTKSQNSGRQKFSKS